MTIHEIPVRQSQTDFPEPEQPVGEGVEPVGEGRTRLSEDLLPNLYELNSERAVRGLPSVTRQDLVDRAAEYLKCGAFDQDIPGSIRAYYLPDAPEVETSENLRPTMKTSILAAVLLALALLAGFLVSRGEDSLAMASESRATAARELSSATVALDAAKTRYGAAKARYEAAYRLESCLVSLTGAAGSGSCR